MTGGPIAWAMEAFDLFPSTRPRPSGKSAPKEEYAYELPCFCGEVLLLKPRDGECTKCPCGATATFDGKAVLELA